MTRKGRKRVNVTDAPVVEMAPFGGGGDVVEPFAVIVPPDDITPAVIAGAPQFHDGSQIIPGDELADLYALQTAVTNSAVREKAFRDGVLYAAFLNARQRQRAAELASDYGLTFDDLGEYAPPPPRDR